MFINLYVCFFPFGFECTVWDLIVLVPDHCVSFYWSFRIFEVLQMFLLPNVFSTLEGIFSFFVLSIFLLFTCFFVMKFK